MKRIDGKKKTVSIEDGKMDNCIMTMKGLRDLAEKEANVVQCALKDMEDNLIDPEYILDLTKSIHGTGIKNMSDYVSRHTEILLNEHAAEVRQKVTQKMKRQIQNMNEEMSQEAKKLGEDHSNFFDFIQSSYEAASNSFRKVVEIAKENYKKVELINETREKLFSVKSELKDVEEQLLECLMCYAFLANVAPEDGDVKQIPLSKEFLKSFGPTYSAEQSAAIQKQVLENILKDESFEPTDLSGTSKDVMKVINRLKNSNLSLVHNSHLKRGSLKFEVSELTAAKRQMDEELELWDAKIKDTEEELKKVQETHEALQTQLSDLVKEDVEHKNIQKENELQQMASIYKICTGSEAKVTDLVFMRTAINNYIEGLISEINTHPRRKIKELVKVIDAEKKLSERKAEETLRAQRANERLKKSLNPGAKQDKKIRA